MSHIYAGDLSTKEAFQALQQDPACKLIDVRTKAEAVFVGAPKLGSDILTENQEAYCLLEWQSFPSMQKNDSFVEQLHQQLRIWQQDDNVDIKDRKLLFLCRSGVRSKHAADVATQLGCLNSHNILGGFEGDVDSNGHRATVSGWKYEKLPWSL